jgi:hypothetical protein
MPQWFDFVAAAGLEFGRWVRQAAYLPQCGALASSPHRRLLTRPPVHEQYAAVALFRGTMVRHSAVVYRRDRPSRHAVGFEGRRGSATCRCACRTRSRCRNGCRPGAAAVVINGNHTYTDLNLPLDAQQKKMFDAIDGERTIADIVS